MLPLRQKKKQIKKNLQVLSYLVNGHNRNNTSQSNVRKLYYRRSFLLLRENRPSGTFSLSQQFYGIQFTILQAVKKNISYESSNELSFVVLSFTKRMTSYALAKSESKSNWGFVFFFSMMFASCFKNEPLFLIHVPDYWMSRLPREFKFLHYDSDLF